MRAWVGLGSAAAMEAVSAQAPWKPVAMLSILRGTSLPRNSQRPGMVITQEFTMKTPDNSFKPKPLRDSDGFLALGR